MDEYHGRSRVIDARKIPILPCRFPCLGMNPPHFFQHIYDSNNEFMLMRACIVAILLSPVWCIAGTDLQHATIPQRIVELRLPELSGGDSESHWGIDISEEGAGLGFKNGKEHWAAQVGSTFDGLSSIRVEHLERVTDRLALGSSISHEEGTTALLLNSVYAPSKDSRIRFEVAQRMEDAPFEDSPSVSQESILFGAKRIWRRGPVSNVAIRLFGGRAREFMSDFPSSDGNDAFPDDDSHNDTVHSRLQGASIEFGIRPHSHGTLRFQYEMSRTSHYGLGMETNRLRSSTVKVEYARTLSNCTYLTSQWAAMENSNAIDLTLSRQHWRVQASRTIGNESSTRLMFAFVHALEPQSSADAQCGQLESEPIFEPILEAAGNQPEQLLYDARFPQM
ncbi:hypothetical protein [Noviherbaspirillum aerium]|uniref:hypothetical protein n=1 Tax=Noviherbaspirillum aerium TaxID=2588497 RepID=UPI00124DB8F4|nr:hypothetical protein [Noviherbaspirillum aerium]